MMGRISAACAAALLLAFGAGAATPAAAQGYSQGGYYQDSYYQPASQDMLEAAPQKTPWYLPQAWVYPKNTAPVVQRRPGEYGSGGYSRNAYGGFGNYCYGNCGFLPGTIATGSGVILWEPDIVMFDRRVYQIVPRAAVAIPQPPVVAVERRAPRPTAESLIRVSTLQQSTQRNLVTGTPRFTLQNGVRIIAPQPLDRRQ
jgi:hypothetical protein